jgi:hypothetical protein
MYMTGLGSDGATEEEERKAMIHLEDTAYEGRAVLPKLLHLYVISPSGMMMYEADIVQQLPGWHTGLL